MEVLYPCKLFVEHRWKTSVCSNCFRDKNQHPYNSKPDGSLVTLGIKTAPYRCGSGNCANGINCAGFSDIANINASLLFQGASTVEPLEGLTRNVLRVDNSVHLSKQTGGGDLDIRADISLREDVHCVRVRSSRYCAQNDHTQPPIEGATAARDSVYASARHGGKPLDSSSCARPNSGSELSSLVRNHEKHVELGVNSNKGQAFEGIQQVDDLGERQFVAKPKISGNSQCLDCDLANGSGLNCERLFACDAIIPAAIEAKILNDNTNSHYTPIALVNDRARSSVSCSDRSQAAMVVLQGDIAEQDKVLKDQRDCRLTSGTPNRLPEFDSKTRESPSLNDAAGKMGDRKEENGIPDEFREQTQPMRHYGNIPNDFKLSEHPRQVFELRRRSRKDSIDSTDEPFSSRNQKLYQSEYECMSSPDSFSTSSSNRSSNTSSLHSNYSPDSVSLASFAGRYNFGRWEGSKRCSQGSSASQDSGHRSWEKTRDSPEFNDGTNRYFARRNSSEHIYENTSSLTQETLKNWNSRENDMDAPPLPVRQCPPSSAQMKPEKVELIMPYKIVDLEELQKSLECDEIDPYSIYDGSMSPDSDTCTTYSPCVDPEPELTTVVARDSDTRPALPIKRRSLSRSLSETSGGSGVDGGKERPRLLPRQSMVVNDTALPRQPSWPDQTSTDEEFSPLDDSTSFPGHRARQKSLPNDRVSRSRRNSASPQKTARPQRTAPPPPPSPPPSRAISPSGKGPLARPVSEMYPRPQESNSVSPKTLKRSNTVAVLRSPFGRIQVEAIKDHAMSARNSVQDQSVPSSSNLPSSQAGQTGLVENEKSVQPKEDASKSSSSKSGVFFAKSNVFKKVFMKKAGTKKQAKKELVISSPTDFASMNQSKYTVDYEYRGRKCVSFVDDGECDKRESAHIDAKAEKVDEEDEQFYHNFPLSHAVDSPEKPLSPKKPLRNLSTLDSKDPVCHDGYLEPCTSQHTKDREDEINQNKLPALGPLPSPPAESTPVTEHAPTLVTTGQDTKVGGVSQKPVMKVKPALPRRPQSLKLKRKYVVQLNEKYKDAGQNPILATEETIPKPPQESAKNNANCNGSILEKTARRSRSCGLIDVEDTRDSYVTKMHVTVLKDILLCWRKMLRKPAISLAGACWEDFEVVEVDSWPKVCDDQGSVLQPVQLKKPRGSMGSLNCSGQFMAKIKSQTQPSNATKSRFDQDYSVCTSVASHENIARVLAYFRGDIRSPLLSPQNGVSQVHTTISISDQVPTGTCEEFVAELAQTHNVDTYSRERTICLLVLQCLKGLNHLHESGFTHGMLTLSNMFLIKKANDFQLFLGNFGRSQPLPKERRGSGLIHRNDNVPSDRTKSQNRGCPENDTETISKPEPKLSLDRRCLENGTEGISRPEPKVLRNDLVASADVISALLYSGLNCNDQNGNLVDMSKKKTSAMFGFLEKASARLRDGTATLRQTVGLLQTLLWGPFESGENVCILSEGRAKQWLERQRSEFIARLAMDEALSRTAKREERPRFSMEDLLLCEYISVSTPSSLIRTGKCWFFDS